jgi:RNA polymerase primary sigma factor
MLEIAQEADASLKTIEKVMQSFKDVVSLDTFIEDDGESLINSFLDHRDNPILENAILSNLSQVIDVTLSDLTQREKEIVKLRFGIGKNHDHTLEEIGWQLDLTRERIRQILDGALNKLRTPEHIMELKDFI